MGMEVPELLRQKGRRREVLLPFLGAIWRGTGMVAERRERAIRDVVATLAACPQPGGPPALRGIGDYGEPMDCGPAAISYELLRQRILVALDVDGVEVIHGIAEELGLAKDMQGRSGPPGIDYLHRPRMNRNCVRGLPRNGPPPRKSPVNPQIRPNELGGRKPSNLDAKTAKALAVFRQELELLHEDRLGRRQLHVFAGDPASEGAGLIRLSSDDVQGGDTAKGQLLAGRQLLAKVEMPDPRYWIVETNTSGFAKWDLRLGLKWLEPKLGRSIKWVVVREPDRTGRDRETVGHLYSLLQERYVKLYYWWPFGRAVNWATDEMQLDMLHVFATNEGRVIKRRTHGALVNRFLIEGRGWPGTKRFGMTRDEDKFIVPAPAGMKLVLWIAQRYNELGVKGKGGCGMVAAELAEQHGVVLSKEKVRHILSDPIYSTGEWYVHYHGYRVACRRVPLGELAVPRPLYLENLQLLGLKRGHHVNNAPAENLLNHVPFLHANCINLLGGSHQVTPRLMAYRQAGQDKDPNYSHHPLPDNAPSECRGLALPKLAVEAFVVRTLLDIMKSDEIRQAHASAVRAEETEHELKPSEDELADARAKAARLRASLHELERNMPGEPGEYEAWSAERWMEYRDLVKQQADRAAGQLADVEDRGFEVPAVVQALAEADDSNFMQKLERVLTVHTPDDPQVRFARAAVFSALVDKIVLHTTPTGWFIELFGPIAPNGLRAQGTLSPIQAADDELRTLEAAGMLDEPAAGENPDGLETGGEEVEALIEAVYLRSNEEATNQGDPYLVASSCLDEDHNTYAAEQDGVGREPQQRDVRPLALPLCMGEAVLTDFLGYIESCEAVPSRFACYARDDFARRAKRLARYHLLETPPGHGPAWQTPALRLEVERAANSTWDFWSVLRGLVLLVEAIDPECTGASLNTEAAHAIAAEDFRIPLNVAIGKVATMFKTTPAALRDLAREHVRQRNAAMESGDPAPSLPTPDALARADAHFARSWWTPEAMLTGLCIAVRELDPDVMGRSLRNTLAYRRLALTNPQVPHQKTVHAWANRHQRSVDDLHDEARRAVWAERVRAANLCEGSPPLQERWPGPRDHRRRERWTPELMVEGLCVLIDRLDPKHEGRARFKHEEHIRAHGDDERVPYRSTMASLAKRQGLPANEFYVRAYARLRSRKATQSSTDTAGTESGSATRDM